MKSKSVGLKRFVLGVVAVSASAAAVADDIRVGYAGTKNRIPEFLGPISSEYYDGKSDDLLTAGLGCAGLPAEPPSLSSPPKAAELRKRAIHTNYRAVLDISAAGGYGTLYGPNIAADGTLGECTAEAGKIAGSEYIAYADDGSGRKNVTLMVQVPETFKPDNACIVTATASGSRGVYGAIGASGEWGLKRGCAVAYTDKGTGNGLHDLETNTVGLIDGTRTDANTAGKASHFTAALSESERQAFKAAFPNRVAYKHAHSQHNPEQDWGRNTLQSIAFAFYVLNEKFGTPDRRDGKRIMLDTRNTIVIASGISNGGAGALAAAEQDRNRLIDAVVTTEPNAQPEDTGRLKIVQGATEMPTIGKPLYDYFTFANLYQPCAALSARAAGSPGAFLLGIPNAAGANNRCAGLHAKGLLKADTLVQQAEEALDKLRAYGWLPDSDVLQASHYRLATNAIAVTYANAYGRFSVADNVCGFSFANTDASGKPAPQNRVLQEGLFATGNGVPPTTGVNIVYNDAQGGPTLDLLALSPSTNTADFALDGAICHRNLVEGRDIVTGAPLSGEQAAASQRVRRGIDDVLLTARLRFTPAIIVHGRADALVPVNHSSRAYYGVNQLESRWISKLRYIEVTNGQHFDAFLPATVVPGYDSRFVPLHVYLIQALDLMYQHLKHGKPLPPSQVVRTKPRGTDQQGKVPPITADNLPAISDSPDQKDKITFQRHTLYVPD